MKIRQFGQCEAELFPTPLTTQCVWIEEGPLGLSFSSSLISLTMTNSPDWYWVILHQSRPLFSDTFLPGVKPSWQFCEPPEPLEWPMFKVPGRCYTSKIHPYNRPTADFVLATTTRAAPVLCKLPSLVSSWTSLRYSCVFIISPNRLRTLARSHWHRRSAATKRDSDY